MRLSCSILLAAMTLPIGARPVETPSGTLILDARAPVVDVLLAGVPLRLRVDLAQQHGIQLNPAAAARLPVRWEDDVPLDVGRVRVSSRIAAAKLAIAGRTLPAQVEESGRDCCRDADGAIGPDALPYATVRWRRPDAPAANGSRTVPLARDDETGLSAPAEVPGVRIRFALAAERTIATAAAGAILARAWAGQWSGPETRAEIVLGIIRPVRTIAFARPGRLAGFAVDRLPVRASDFGGDEHLPDEPGDPADVVVRHRLPPQHAWAAVTFGQDRLARCAEIAFDAAPRSLTLRCAFDHP